MLILNDFLSASLCGQYEMSKQLQPDPKKNQTKKILIQKKNQTFKSFPYVRDWENQTFKS